MIDSKIMSIIKPHAISGRAHVNTEDSLLSKPKALAMLIDVFSERGFFASVDIHLMEIPNRVDSQYGQNRMPGKEGVPYHRALQRI